MLAEKSERKRRRETRQEYVGFAGVEECVMRG